VAFILALDQGTTSSRAIVFDDDQNVLGTAQQPFDQIFPHPGWVEHDPRVIWQTQRDVAIEAMSQAKIDRTQIAAIGITNQRETTVVWDRHTGEPIYNAIVWQDRRTASSCVAKRDAGHEPQVQNITGLLLDPYFSASKIRWILDNCAGALESAAAGNLAFGTIDTWLIWNLTGGRSHITDPSNASRTSLFNLETGRWDEAMLDLWEIPRSMLPEVTQSSGHLARCTIAGLENIEVTGIAGDQQAALFGQTCFSAGEAKCTYGTGCFVLLNSGRHPIRSNNRLLTTVAWTIDGETEYALEGSVFIGGAVVQWLRDGLEIIDRSEDVEALAAGLDPGAHARHNERAYRTRRLGGDRVPGSRRPRRHAGGHGRDPNQLESRRRSKREQSVDANAVGYPADTAGQARESRKYGAWGRVPRRSCRRHLEGSQRVAYTMA